RLEELELEIAAAEHLHLAGRREDRDLLLAAGLAGANVRILDRQRRLQLTADDEEIARGDEERLVTETRREELGLERLEIARRGIEDLDLRVRSACEEVVGTSDQDHRVVAEFVDAEEHARA